MGLGLGLNFPHMRQAHSPHSPESSLSVLLSSWSWVLPTPVTLDFWNLSSSALTLGPLGSTWVPPPSLSLGLATLPGLEVSAVVEAPFIGLSLISPSLPDVQGLVKHCFIILSFGHFRWEGKSKPCHSILPGRGDLHSWN